MRQATIIIYKQCVALTLGRTECGHGRLCRLIPFRATVGIYAIALLSALFVGPSITVAKLLIEEGDVWRYFKGRSSEPPTDGNGRTWIARNYDVGDGWSIPKPSGFGYGDHDDATELDDMRNGYVSLYIRKTFSIPNTAGITHLTLAVDYDDGFVAYVNGVEVARRNLATGVSIGHDTTASVQHEASRGKPGRHFDSYPQEKEFIAIDPGLLVPGENVLAVSGHNASIDSSDFTLATELYSNTTVARGPYIQMPDGDGITIVWDTERETGGTVEFGYDRTYSDGIVEDAQPKRRHAVKLTGLEPGSEVFYRIRTDGVVLSDGHMVRIPSAPQQAHRFAVIGDFGYKEAPEAATKKIAAQVNQLRSDWLLTVGDNIYQHGQPGYYDDFWFKPYAPTMARGPTFPALGNHDIESEAGRWLLEYFHLPRNGPNGLKERHYSFDYANVHVTVIDSNLFVGNDPDELLINTTADWLEDDLAATEQPWKVVVLHHAFHASPGSRGTEPRLKSVLEDILERNGVQLVFQGHNHWYERSNPVNGVHYITTGGGGRSLHRASKLNAYTAKLEDEVFSFVIVDVEGDTLHLRAIDADGGEFDMLDLDLGHPFEMDGLLDDTTWKRASQGLDLYAAIRGNILYVAVQDAGEGSDHFVFVADVEGSQQKSVWNKAGKMMAWSAFLADENDNGFHGWFDRDGNLLKAPAGAYRSMTSGKTNNPRSVQVLEGTLDLVEHFGEVPEHLFIAAAPYKTRNGGGLISDAQVPMGDGGKNLEKDEFLFVSTEDLVVALP